MAKDIIRTEEYLEKEAKDRDIYVLNKQKKILENGIKNYKELIPLLEKELSDINKKIKEVIKCKQWLLGK